MKKKSVILYGLLILCFSAFSGFAQTSNIYNKELSQSKINEIIKKMTENEEDFRYALSNYVFNRKAVIQTVGLGGQITGTYRRDSFMTFTDKGERFEKILFNPVSSLKDLRITPEDLDDLGGINPFALSPSQVSLYNFNYLGKEKIDELDLYVFDVSPKVMPNPKKTDLRLFQGRIWVDDRDLMIVKSKGKAVPDSKDNKFPVVETWRENIDGKYWFPAYTSSDDELVFDNGSVIKLKMRVSYANYRQGRSTVTILDDDEEVPAQKPKENPSNEPPPLPTKKP
jgi:outer membrane lipoprotein-sorting protein